LAERALPEDSTTHEDEGLDDERGDVADEETGGGAEPTPTAWALRGAVVGAIAGGVTGAGLGMLFARSPDSLTQAKSAIGESGTNVARAAAVAAGEVMASNHLNQLFKAEDSGDRGELMKRAAREAGLAAATAARDQIITLRGDAVGSGSREVVEGGGNGKR
jgi:hypothetical protein